MFNIWQIILHLYLTYKQPYNYLETDFSFSCLCYSELGEIVTREQLWKCGN